MQVLWTGEIHPDAEQLFSENDVKLTLFGTHDLLEEDAFTKALERHDAYVSGGFETLSGAVIGSSQDLKLAIFLGADPTGYFDLQAAKQHEVTITNTPGANSSSVAELAVGYCIMSVRRVVQFSRYANENKWSPETVRSLYGSQISLLGMGFIGQKVVKALRALGCEDLKYWSRSRKPTVEEEFGIEFCDFDEAISDSDVISLHVPGDMGEIIGEREVMKMRKDVNIVNTARPSLISPAALKIGIDTGRLASVAMDGFYGDGKRELTAEEQELLSVDNSKLIVTPHIGWRTVEADKEMHVIAAQQVLALKSGASIPHIFE